MDFIGPLPTLKEYDRILIVINKLIKYTIIIPYQTNITAPELAKLFIIEIIKYWGIPRIIILNRDPLFKLNY